MLHVLATVLSVCIKCRHKGCCVETGRNGCTATSGQACIMLSAVMELWQLLCSVWQTQNKAALGHIWMLGHLSIFEGGRTPTRYHSTSITGNTALTSLSCSRLAGLGMICSSQCTELPLLVAACFMSSSSSQKPAGKLKPNC